MSLIPDWQDRAACKGEDTALFYEPDHREAPKDRERREQRACAFCGGCPVRWDCLEHAMSRPEKHGIWGGLNERDRGRLRRRRQRAALEASRQAGETSEGAA
ncbi:MAG: WhiB family transcriptional regulator [Actinomycetota bacterium]|nr:WhiB family transcriptional regulator [Actinomycetota bacterium]